MSAYPHMSTATGNRIMAMMSGTFSMPTCSKDGKLIGTVTQNFRTTWWSLRQKLGSHPQRGCCDRHAQRFALNKDSQCKIDGL